MAAQKYDIPKTFKFSERDNQKLQAITDDRNFSSDTKANIFCVNLVWALLEKNMLAETVAKLIEDM